MGARIYWHYPSFQAPLYPLNRLGKNKVKTTPRRVKVNLFVAVLGALATGASYPVDSGPRLEQSDADSRIGGRGT